MSRTEYLVENYGQRLADRLYGTGRIHSTSACLEAVHPFMEADPSFNKRFSTWIILTFLNGGFLYEDLYKVNDTLELFIDNQSKLPLDKRDIGRYRRLSDLWADIKQFNDEQALDLSPTGHALRRADKQKAIQESLILVNKSDITVAVPMTEFSSKWWGRGTRWCTAAEKDNAFVHYNYSAPLFVIDLKKDGKFQLHADYSGLQFMNEDDSPVEKDIVKLHQDKFEPLLRWVVSHHGVLINKVSELISNPEHLRLAVEQQGLSIAYIPLDLVTYDLCRRAVRQNARCLSKIPAEYIDYELCLEAVHQVGEMIDAVPQHILEAHGDELYLAAVSSSPLALDFIRDEHLTEALCKAAVTNSFWAMERVPERFMTYDLCKEAVRHFGYVLHFVPTEFRDYEMCKSAVINDGAALCYVPKELRDLELCVAAISNVHERSDVLSHIPWHFRSYDNGLSR